MAQHSHDPNAVAMSIAARAAFVMIPLLSLVFVLWTAASVPLPASIQAAWVPALGVNFNFHIDGLSLLMLLMITGVGTAVFVYAGGYLEGHPQQNRLYILLTLFMFAMIGCVTADNLIVLFLFWEMTSLLSFMLVGFNHEDASSRKSAQQALVVTGSGGLALLAGAILLGQVMGTYSIQEIISRVPGTEPSTALTTALLLILLGAFTKSAQFPFHFWLPNAMSAPTPVSAYLHSATMVKLGVYLVARLDPGFGDWPLWQWTLQIVGSITAAWGMLLALRERDLKRILAWSTVATLGTLVMLVGMDGQGATVAVGALLLAHALYKAPLFFVAGNVDHGTGTRIIDQLGNLRHAMPWTAAAALLAGFSMAGVPLSFGYVVKDVITEAKTVSDVLEFANVANTIFGAVAVAVAAVAAVRIFWRHPGHNDTPEAHEGGLTLVGPPLVLAFIGVVLGLFPFLADWLVGVASQAMSPRAEAVAVHFAVHAGPGFLSLLMTLLVGVAVFWFWDPLHRLFDRWASRFDAISMVTNYDRFIQGIPRLAALSTRALQHGSLPGYSLLIVAFMSAFMGVILVAGWHHWVWPDWVDPTAGFVVACLLTAAGGVLAVLQRDRFVLLLAAGLVGFGSAIFFTYTGAPDVAYTQLVVESVFVIVVASVLLNLKKRGMGMGHERIVTSRWALPVAVVFGGVLTLWMLVAVGGAFDPALTQFFAEKSVPDAHGRNVVNVILVDFRALDTLGEITVVMLSFMAALPLLQAVRVYMRRNKPGTNVPPGDQA
ncbi:MAG: proton-conducting transporter membrane subunit [Hydrogenophaga sp.]|uniref:hydrogen gas-evolving membrane-bound hydrogenase subunit E n=1 Tax=Hydrogenophaga sp. TaxID=1904254 RepID=UPI00271781AB|nr:hydrogen gas-evolving membrane-bound hydrogenase subunit E [Hydrogenophaga sp.]MDO9149133.1 proton-conducting transporter membrane subunit [Hydrogenophaga sp.]MDO9604492.1 proton-conducting transporter membrane subunit [Hydrogenophaga sp.]MDP2163715.1 proton-conducting transporter membrane subunit [Hydrogenophaga sp.]MDP3475939.1 proton-conducting transporter membrane subunit [Hydrogenophaga sp.]